MFVRSAASLFFAVAAFAGYAAAQQAPPSATPSKVQPVILGMTRELVKPGQTPVLLQARAAALKSMAAMAGVPNTVALRSITGREEMLYLHFYDSMGVIEDAADRLAANPAEQSRADALTESEGNLLLEKRDMTTIRLGDLAYRPDVDWSQMQYLDFITIHVRPGHHLEYLELRKMARDGHIKGGLDTNLIVFKTTSGAPSPLYFILRPMKSLHTHDDLRAKGFGEPLTDDENNKMIGLLARAVESEEEEFYKVEPAASTVSPAFAAPNAAFWNGKH